MPLLWYLPATVLLIHIDFAAHPVILAPVNPIVRCWSAIPAQNARFRMLRSDRMEGGI